MNDVYTFYYGRSAAGSLIRVLYDGRVAEALARGHHVHINDMDGEHCLADHCDKESHGAERQDQ